MSAAARIDGTGLPTDEWLTDAEVLRLTGKTTGPAQCRELDDMGWRYIRRGNKPLIGRWYARLKAAGINPSSAANDEPDMSAIS